MSSLEERGGSLLSDVAISSLSCDVLTSGARLWLRGSPQMARTNRAKHTRRSNEDFDFGFWNRAAKVVNER
jgi:hypothetical protein